MALRGVSQDTVAEALGFGQSQVSRRLLGQIDFSAVELLKLAELLDVAVQWFLDLDHPTVPAPRGAGERRPHGASAAAAPDAPPTRTGGDGSPATPTPVAGEPHSAAARPHGEVAGGPGHPTLPARRDPEESTSPRLSATATPGGPDPNEKRAADATATR